jgi:hypothetical protein
VHTQSSKIGRPRKVICQGNAKIAFTGRTVTAHAGMALVARAMEGFDLRRQFSGIYADMDAVSRQGTAEMLEQLIALRLLGGEAISDMALMREPALKALFGWDSIAHGATFGRRLKRFSWRHNEGLQHVLGGLYRRLAPTGQRLVAIDSTVATVFGCQQGAARGYNPHKPGRLSYHPLLAVDVDERAVVDGYLRPGCAGSGNGLEGFIRKIVSERPAGADGILFRLDKGLCSGPVLDTIEELHGGYVAKFKLTQRIAGRISRIRRWRSLGNGIFAANFRYQPHGWKRPRRFVVIERNEVPRKDPIQLSLFELMEGRYEVICTNQRLKAENIWHLYNRGAVVEQIIDELKNDLSATGIRTDSFWANDALFITGLIAYNLLNCIRKIALPRAFRAARLKRLSFLFFTLGANVVRHARGLWIKIGRDYPFRLIFYRALAALKAA